MSNFVEFLRMFLSYGVVFLVFVVAIAIGIFAGIKMAQKKQNTKAKEENRD